MTNLDLIVNRAGKKAMLTVGAGYCPNNGFPEFLYDQVAHAKVSLGRQHCPILQFIDPHYVNLYKEYITALADHLADFDANDARPNETDIVYLRGETMAVTMENLPKPSQFKDLEWKDFVPAPNGHIYKQDMNNRVIDEYYLEVMLFYRQELDRAYNAKNLTPPHLNAGKAGDFWGTSANAKAFIENGINFEKLSSDPSPDGMHWDMELFCRTGLTRCAKESGNNWPLPVLNVYNHFEALFDLSIGMEFAGYYGRNRRNPDVQPLGAVSDIHNREAMLRVDGYAGFMREPAQSPGAWIAFAGAYPQRVFNGVPQHSLIWRNRDFLLTDHEPQESVLLFGVKYDDDPGRKIVPILEMDSKSPDWAKFLAACEQEYGVSECKFIQKTPDLYIGTNTKNGKHQHTFSETDLGEIWWCGSDMFCQDESNITKRETMLWARRTDSANGKNHIRLDLHEEFAQSIGTKACVTVTYLDRGTDRFSVKYDAAGNSDKTLAIVVKTNTNRWMESETCVKDAAFDNGQPGGNDISLFNMRDGDDIFHLVQVTRQVPVTVLPPLEPEPTATTAPTSAANVYSGRIANTADDATEYIAEHTVGEEEATSGTGDLGTVDLGAPTMRIPGNGNAESIHGLRFTGINIPRGSTIVSAHIVFEAESKRAVETDWLIRAEKSDSARPISQEPGDLSERTQAQQFVQWPNVPTWEAGKSYRTPDLSNIVQGLVNRDGWQGGNNILFLIDGNGVRIGWSFDGDPNRAPLLEITYEEARSTVVPTLLPATNTPTPEPTNTPVDTPTITPLLAPTEVVDAPTPVPAQRRVYRVGNKGRDDVVEIVSRKDVTHSGIDITINNQRMAGLRFERVTQPPGTVVKSAYIEVVAAANGRRPTLLTIRGEASGNAALFKTNGPDLSRRAVTDATLVVEDYQTWQKGSTYQIPVSPEIIDEILGRLDRVEDGAVVLLISATGTRKFVSFEGDFRSRPKLFISYEAAQAAPSPTSTPTRTPEPEVPEIPGARERTIDALLTDEEYEAIRTLSVAEIRERLLNDSNR